MLTAVSSKSRVVVETEASGLLAALAHDLRIEAPVTEGESGDGAGCRLRFEVARMKVVESRRHGSAAWHAPSPSDAADIEGRIAREVFQDMRFVTAEGVLDGTRARLTVRAKGEEVVDAPIHVERGPASARASGRVELSLRALETGKVHVPLGAIKLHDRVVVAFDLTFEETR